MLMDMAMAAACILPSCSTTTTSNSIWESRCGFRNWSNVNVARLQQQQRAGIQRLQLRVSSALAAEQEELRNAGEQSGEGLEEEEEEGEAPVKKPIQRLKTLYLEKVVPSLTEEFKYTNVHQVPKLVKVIVNCGHGEASQNAKVLEAIQRDLALITGQKPIVTRAEKAVSTFKLRKGVPVGCAVTLRGEIMFAFLDRLINLAFPRTRDFQGVSPYCFDGHGNYNVGLRDQGVFPEIKYQNLDKPRGMDIAIVTTANTDKEGERLLKLLGMPFQENTVRPPVVRKSKGAWKIKKPTTTTKQVKKKKK